MTIDRQHCSRTSLVRDFCILLFLWSVGLSQTAFCQSPRPEPPKQTAGGGTYVLSANDLIKMSVFEEADLETTVRISSDGTVTFPLIGTVKVVGKTPQVAAGLVRELYAKDYLVNPQVNLTVMEYAKRRFIILGQVQRPGTFDMPDRDSVSLLQAIGMAGGYSRIADAAKITVKRTVSGKETLVKVNGKRMASGEENVNFEVLPGDIISVGESLF